MSTALVSLVDGIPTTSSKLVAETFGKRHSDVLRDIERVCTQVPENFRERNFASASYEQEAAFGKKANKLYLLTRDGLTLLVMGYTGKEAMKFKLAYIEAFNAMEAQLKNQPAQLPLSTVADRRPLNTIVHTWAQKSDQKYSMCWKQVNSAFGLAKAAEFPAHWIPDAVAWVQEKIDSLPEKKALPLPSHILDLTLDTPIGYQDLLDALASLAWRMEKTCQSELDAEFEKGRKLFSKAAKDNGHLNFMLCSSLVGPKHATLEMLKSALRMAETAYKTHFLVCEAGK